MSTDLKTPWKRNSLGFLLNCENSLVPYNLSREQEDALAAAVNERESLRAALKDALKEMKTLLIAYDVHTSMHALAEVTRRRITAANEALKGE